MSDDLVRDGGAAATALGMREVAQDLEGIGQVQTHFVGVEDIPSTLPPLQDPSWPQRITSTLGMVGRGLRHVLLLRRPRVLTSAG